MITVWTVDLDAEAFQRAERLAQLDDVERARAARFHFAQDARRWRAAHVALREVLARHTGVAAAALPFAEDPNGKPRLAMPQAIAFNLSHSAGLALIAVGGTQPLGVDVEDVKPVPEMEGVAESHFAADERAALFALSEPERLAAFYRIWTRKEAYVKATGIGVGPALARFSVSLEVPRAVLLRDELDASARTRWTLHHLALPAPYVGALVLHRPEQDFEIRTWS